MLNVFDSIGRATNRREPFHSQFLADALRDSIEGERSLFDAVWCLAAPNAWEPPEKPEVHSELHTRGGRRIDLCIVDDATPKKRVLGVEVKTSSASTQSKQLEAYHYDLSVNYREADIAIAYLTPFNRKRAGSSAERFPEIRVFDKFAGQIPQARHISWLDIAEIEWDGRDIWKQHQSYVVDVIAPKRDLETDGLRSQSFFEFFGTEAAGRFYQTLEELGIETNVMGAGIDLTEFSADANSMVQAFEILILDGKGLTSAEKSDRFPDDLRRRFVESRHREFHEALFDLSRRFGKVWVEGVKDYAIRVAHERHEGGVSLVRSKGTAILETGKPRRARAT